jgi:hypothetical protein
MDTETSKCLWTSPAELNKIVLDLITQCFRSEDGNADAREWNSDDDDGESTLHTETEDRIQERLVDCEILALHPYR